MQPPGESSRRRKWRTGVAISGAGLLLAGGFAAGHWWNDRDEESGANTEIAPVEYLYLDSDRVVSYLSQLQGGLSKGERRSRTRTEDVNAGIKAAGVFDVGASAQRQRFVEEVVTATAVSDYVRFFNALTAKRFVRELDPRYAAYKGIRAAEGRFVKITTDNLVLPAYTAPYIVARQSGTLRALFPRSRAARRQAKDFARRVGPNPRMAFFVGLRDNPAKAARYLLPLQYEGLTDERSLLKGGVVTIVGKVIRRLPSIPDASGRVVYRDFAVRETWRGPLERVPGSLLRHVIRSRSTGSCRRPKLNQVRSCLIRELNKSTAVHRPGAVVIPIAIYK